MNTNHFYLQVQDLTLAYKKQLVLKHVNFTINPGDWIGITGINGSGKTTLVESLVGLRKINAGVVIFSDEVSNHVATIFQETNFDRYLNLKENFKYLLELNNKHPKQELQSIFKKYGIDNVMNKNFENLSGGQKQRFKILLALESKPKLLIMDEFNNSVDFESKTYFIDMIKQYLINNPDCALIIVSHDANELKTLTNKIYKIKDNELVLSEQNKND